MNEKDKVALEKIIDRNGLAETVDVMAEICSEKADHIRSSYDDDELADQWDGAAEELQDLRIDIAGED